PGHRVVSLSEEGGSQSLYFHYNSYSADGKKLVFTHRRMPDAEEANEHLPTTFPTSIFEVDLNSREVKKVADGRVIETGRKTNEVFYTRQGVVYAADLGSLAEREVV